MSGQKKVKQVSSKEVQLWYPDFTKLFETHTNASECQLGAVITQKNQPIAHFSRKLNKSQCDYTVTELELLAMVETLKEFCSVLLGQDITMCTDHKNLTYKVFNTERVMRWRLTCEEHGPKLVHLKGDKNIVADALSRLHLKPTPKSQCDDSIMERPMSRELAESFLIEDMVEEDDLPEWTIPVSYELIFKEQRKDEKLRQECTDNKNNQFKIRSFSQDSNTIRKLITYNDKIYVPKTLEKRMVQWYHEMLCHPGAARTEETIAHHFHWPKMRDTVRQICCTCDQCQRTKRHVKNTGNSPQNRQTLSPGKPYA